MLLRCNLLRCTVREPWLYMVEKRAERRLAAILAADVVGYSRLMERDEAGTLAALKARRKEVLEPLVAKHQGRIFKVSGDGVLVEFASAVNAVQCAVELQEAMTVANADVPNDHHIVLRIGVNLGDVMVEGSDLYGEGVNIAARLEALADAASVIVSRTVFNHVRGKVKFGFDDLGDQPLKNMSESVQVYRLRLVGEATMARPVLPLPNRPSIAVLPFQNMSGDTVQEYFADGIVDEITTALSRLRWLFVIARNSSFTYKGRAIDVRQIGRELGVRYVLEGSVRKAGNRVRITGELVDASTGTQLWSDRFEGELEDIFDLQDKVTAKVIGALAPKLELAEIERALRKPTESLDAYDYYLRGMGIYNQWNREASREALSLFKRAIEHDPKFASAYGMAARCYVQRKGRRLGNRSRPGDRRDRALGQACGPVGQRRLHRAWDGGFCTRMGCWRSRGRCHPCRAGARAQSELCLGWGFSGWINVWLGKPEMANEHLACALRLSPHDPLSLTYQTALACAQFFNGRYADAWSWAETAMRDRPDYAFPHCIGAASGALAGRMTEAKKTMARLRELMPNLRISNLSELFPLRRPQDVSNFADGLRKAGLPE